MQREAPQAPPWVEKLAWVMDNSISIGPWRIGVDGLLGLIPGAGDLTSTMAAAMIILSAARDGVPRNALMRMVANVAIDSVVGAIPVIGDVFDFAYKANAKNVRIYREALAGRRDSKQDWAFLALLALALAAVLAIPIALLVWLVRSV